MTTLEQIQLNLQPIQGGDAYGCIEQNYSRVSWMGDYKPDRRRAKTHQRSRKHEITRLWEVHHEIIRRVALGEKGSDIAKDLGITEAVVSYTRNSKIAEDRIEIMKGAMDADTIDLGIRIRQIAPKALDLIETIVKGDGAAKDASLALRAREANGILDRAGYGAVKKFMGVSTHLTSEDIERIKQRARESGVMTAVKTGER